MNDVSSVHVETATGAYDVRIGSGILPTVGPVTSEVLGPRVVAVVSDDRVAPIYAETVLASLAGAGVAADLVTVPAGERSKSWESAGGILEDLARLGLDRDDAVVALGGGVIGDLAGFCAASYMRGIPFVQVPTTLLAQVDSSVGGKTAVDLAAGKNLAGAFHAPAAVIADTGTLTSLPEDVFADGLAEVVKTAFLAGDPFLSWLEEHVSALRRRDPEVIDETVRAAVRFKADVVASDEHDRGAREQLNLGHTLAHAVERLEGYQGVSHGSAVALGMRFAARLSVRLQQTDPEWVSRQEALLAAACIPEPAGRYRAGDLLEAMHSDKKARGGVVRFVFSTGAGRFETTAVDDDVLADALALWESPDREL